MDHYHHRQEVHGRSNKDSARKKMEKHDKTSSRQSANDQDEGTNKNSTKGPTFSTPKMGLDALHHSEPDILPDTPLRFQWMRPHPDLFFAESKDYTQPQLDFKPGDIEIDLADLICQTPPMMINWVPNVETNVDYLNDRERHNQVTNDDKDMTKPSTNIQDEGDNKYLTHGLTCKSVVEEAMLNLVRSHANISTCNGIYEHMSQSQQLSRSSLLHNKTTPLKTVDQELLFLPSSNDLIDTIEDAVIISGKEGKDKIDRKVKMVHLALLSFTCLVQQQKDIGQYQRRIVGRHILCVLVPSILTKFAAGVDTEALSSGGNIQQSLRCVAYMLVSYCGGRDAVQTFYSEHNNGEIIMGGDEKEECMLLNELWTYIGETCDDAIFT